MAVIMDAPILIQKFILFDGFHAIGSVGFTDFAVFVECVKWLEWEHNNSYCKM
jgi:hypothetical protein